MDKILKERIETASAHFADKHPKVSVASVAYLRRDAFQAEAMYMLADQWISVDEALPEANENVLALIGSVPVVAKGYHVRARIRDITHWMPIPKFETKEKK